MARACVANKSNGRRVSRLEWIGMANKSNGRRVSRLEWIGMIFFA